MKKEYADALQQAKKWIIEGDLAEAGKLLKSLKRQFPTSPDVARIWCSWAMRSQRASEVPAYAEKIYLQASNEAQRAHWAHLLGTAHFSLLDLEAAHNYLSRSLNHLIAMARAGRMPADQQQRQQSENKENNFTSGFADQLLWSTCALLAKQKITAIPFAGTLLGLEREGKLLDYDKDIDIAVWMESFDACCQNLEANGWKPVSTGLRYQNYRDYIHADSGITLDVCGLTQRNEQQVVGGFSLPGYPAEYQRVSVFPQLEMEQRQTAWGDTWYPRQPDKILTAFYGDWRTPNPLWDTVISAVNLEHFTLLVRCYAYHRLAKRWLLGDLIKSWSYAHQIAMKDPDDTIALLSKQWLERFIVRTGREIPVWPQNRSQRRVFTRMVGDLFHVGHINFLKAARSLGTHLTVCVVSDQRVLENKGKLPVMTQAERAAAVSACKYVDSVITESPVYATREFMRQNGFDLYTFACADDKERRTKREQCALLPEEMIRELDYTPGISTTEIVRRITKKCDS